LKKKERKLSTSVINNSVYENCEVNNDY